MIIGSLDDRIIQWLGTRPPQIVAGKSYFRGL